MERSAHPALDFWRNNRSLAHITPPGARWAEGFDPIAVLREEIPSGSVLDFGCGDGRLAEAFPQDRYTGVDVNPHAVAFCRSKWPARRFLLAEGELPKADVALASVVLLHIPDANIVATGRRLLAAAPRVLVVEILGREWRGGRGHPACFNRSLEDYEAIFSGAKLERLVARPYRRYGGVSITFMDFRRR